jgi:hypothetical protein
MNAMRFHITPLMPAGVFVGALGRVNARIASAS